MKIQELIAFTDMTLSAGILPHKYGGFSWCFPDLSSAEKSYLEFDAAVHPIALTPRWRSYKE